MLEPERPRRPGRRAGIGEWERYHEAMSRWQVWKQGQRQQEQQRELGGAAVRNTVYSQHLVEDSEDVKSSYDPKTGITRNYFGGYRSADDEWHGDVWVDESGNPTHPKGGRPAGERRGKPRKG